MARVITRLNVGGPSYHVALLSAGLRDWGFATTLLAGASGRAEGDLTEYAVGLGVEPVRIGSMVRNVSPWLDAKAIFDLWAYFRRARPHIVHTHQSKAGTLGRLAARFAGVPIVVHTFHGSGFGVFSRPSVRLGVIAIERVMAGLTDRLIVLGEKQRHDYLRAGIGDAAKMRVVKLGLDLSAFEQADVHRGLLHTELGLDPSCRVVGVASRLVPIKGIDVLIRAAAELRPWDPDLHWVIAGDGEARPGLEALAASLGLADRVHFLGWRRDVPALYADLSVCVLPTTMDFEGTPVAVIEALAARRPVVATDVGGVSQIVQDGRTGLLVDPGSSHALSAAVRRLLEDRRLAERLAGEGQRFAVREHDHRRLVTDIRDVYQEVLVEKGLAPALAAPIS